MEGSSSEPCASSNRSCPEDEFTDLLFPWSFQDILDENLYRLQVKTIPKSFESVDEYLDSYIYPLLEETRAELASALKTAHKAPFAEVTDCKEYKRDKLLYSVKVDKNRRNIRNGRSKEPYRTSPGDFVLLSDSKPEGFSDLKCVDCFYTFASVVNISEDDCDNDATFSSTDFKLKTAQIVEVEHSKPLYVIYLMNMTTNKRIYTALKMRRNLKIIEKVLTKKDSVGGSCEFCPLNVNDEVEEKFGSTLLSRLNESQLESILASTSKIGCIHKSSVELIWGPPGTGKTTVLSSLLFILLKMNVRTLICAPTNIAIADLASRVAKLLRNSVETESGKNMSCPLGDILIFGNKDRLDVGSDIEEIFLDYRAEKLLNCFASQTGWRQCVTSMIEFLEDCVSQHRVFVNNERTKAGKGFKSKSFLEFVRGRFRHLSSTLKRCIRTLYTHLPRSCINELENIGELISLLDSIETLLFESSNLTSHRLEAILQRNIIGYESCALTHWRIKCLSILRSLRDSLDKIGPPNVANRNSTMDFCLQKASLIFCTSSSSYKLHTDDINPFQLLVIDEAAQVKECETLIALQIPDVRHAILVGDEKQLPAIISSKMSESAGFGRSLFERLSLLGHSKHLLNMQYRMHPEISQFPNSKFYRNQIMDAPNVEHESYERSCLKGRMFGPYSFINVRGGREESDEVGHSSRNMVEVSVILKLVQKLFKAWSSSKEKLSIGLISPYAAQVAAIRDKIQAKYDNFEGFTVKVKSIDGFQGSEEDIIIISTVRSHGGGSIGFLSSPQRTNVALTRARHCLWILGNERTLAQSNSIWEALISDAKDRECFFNADEDRDIGKTIIDAKKDFDQLDDLLSAENVLFKNSRWQVLFSEEFKESFRDLTSSAKKMVIHLLLKLASGWRPKKINVDKKCTKSSYVLKQFKAHNYYIICSIDIIKESMYKQVLKVWNISHLPMVETTELFKRLDNIASTYTNEFINHCNDKLFEGNLEVPKSWTCSSDIIRLKNHQYAESSTGESSNNVDCISYLENSKVNERLLLLKFYSSSNGTVNHLLTDLEGREIDLPFEVTDEEREIILFPKSSFILGRSGTGKTTVLVVKLYQKIQQYYIASRDPIAADNICNKTNVDELICESRGTNLHQLFVTVSPKLCHAVKKHVSELKSISTGNLSGCNFGGVDDIEEVSDFKDIPDTFVGIQSEKYPLIITFHKFLMMLDGSLGDSYFHRFQNVRGSTHYDGRCSIALQTFMRKNEVTYDRFQSFYWPRFNTKLTKNLDGSRVYTEIMSHIKGGTQEGVTCDGTRSRETYISLSESRVSTLGADTRSVIYDIFQDYEKKKLSRGEFDLADFVNDIHLRLKNEVLLGDKMDFVYIDEVQDLSMRQISLFRYVCKNVDEGFVFSGDTAQTIARGIDFRFEDIRSLFYNEFLLKSVSGRKEKGLVSDMFNLSQNFRTHTGILNLAQSVVDLICYYFPLSIDFLPRETSPFPGEPPVVLKPGSDENMIISIFGDSGKGGEKWAEFGADQVILVRDDTVKKEILKYIGHKATILTILECKGLEFQDVLLYNFFGSSPLSDQWRVVYDYFQEKKSSHGESKEYFPSFSQSRHHILCSELKHLYVAITRAKQRLWICETNFEFSKPMLNYWKKFHLVVEETVNDSLAKAMQTASSRDEWKSQGIKLFWENNYEMAITCFEKAGEETWWKRAKASALRAASERLECSYPEEAKIMLREAAEIFDSIDSVESAAECFCDLGDYKRAGRIYLEKCGMSELRKAGECFCLAGNYKTAAKVYAKGNFFEECLSSCTKGKYFDLGVQYINYWKEHATSNSEVEIINRISYKFLENCALESYKEKDMKSLMKFVHYFHTFESKRNFLKSIDCLEELLTLEVESRNFNEAAEVAKSIGKVLQEIDLLEKAEQFSNACLLILSYVLSNSLWISGNRGWPMKSFPQKLELLNRAILFAQKVSEDFHALICAEVNIMLHKQSDVAELMQYYNASKWNDSPICEFLSLRKVLDAHFQVDLKNYAWDPEMHLDSRSFDGRISRNQVSAGTLVYLWDLLKEQCFKIVKCLDGLEKLEIIKPEGIVRLCFNYFGVRLVDNFSTSVVSLNPEAAWLRNVDSQFVRRNRKVATLESHHFASAAQKICYQDLVYVGRRVLTALQRLYECSVAKGFSKYHQSMCLLHIFDVAKYFLESRSIVMTNADARKMQDFLILSFKCFDLVFPLDPREPLSKQHMISLRETEVSRNLLEEIVSRNISAGKTLTYGQIGRSLMIMLGTGKLKHCLFVKIREKLSKNTWKEFVQGFHLEDQSKEIFKVLSRVFHKALEETYDANWRVLHDYISPDCFVYILERLLILLPHSQGHFFAAKSSFVEHLMCLPWDADPSASLVMDMKYNHDSIFNFVVRVIKQNLYENDLTVQDWIESSDIDCDYYLPVFVLRLVVILCLSCLNWNSHLDFLSETLALPRVRSQLPTEFYEALQWNDTSFPSAVTRAFKVIGDPLVIVASNEVKLKYMHPDAVFLDLRSFSSRDDIMKTLFPIKTEATLQPTFFKGNNTRNHRRITPFASEIVPETGNGDLKIKWGLFHEMSDALDSLFRDRKDANFKFSVLIKKVEMEDHIKLLTTAVGQLAEKRHSDEDIEAITMIEELNALSSLLVSSDFDLEAMMEIRQLLKSFQARRPQLDVLLSKFNGRVVSEEMDDTDFSGGEPDVSSYAESTLYKSIKGKGRKV